MSLILSYIRSRCSSVSIVSDYRLDDRDSIPDRGRGFFLLAPASRPALGSTQPPFPGDKAWPGRDTDHLPTSSAEVRNE
jgi:hypothetical protein